MMMKTYLKGGYLLLMVLLMACGGRKGTAEADQYTCPMHPTVISATQGACPVCGMDLVRKAREGEEVVITEALAKRLKSPDESVIAKAAASRPVFGRKPLVVEVQGVVAIDSRFVRTIPARVAGRVERVHLRYPYQPVRAGEPVAELYSPEMLAAQRELLYLATTDSALLRPARQKLMWLGATTSQIDAWLKSGEADPRFTVFSPVDGYVILPGSVQSTVSVSAAGGRGGMGEDMNATPTVAETGSPQPPKTELIRAGDYVSRGQALFTVASREAMRLELRVPAAQAGVIRTGDRLTVEVNGGKKHEATVDFVQPFYEGNEVFQTIRVYVRDASLRVGQLVSVRLLAESSETLWVPRRAVADLGTGQIVFVHERGVFKPRAVQTGRKTDEWYEITSGLASSDEVADEAAFLIDSESFIKTDRNP